MATMVFAWFVIALSMVMLSPLLLEISFEFEVGVAIVGQMTTVIIFAAAVSTILIVPFIDRFDRRTAFLVAGLLLAVSAVLALVSWNIWILALSRLLVGISYAFGVPTMFAATAELIPLRKTVSSDRVAGIRNGIGVSPRWANRHGNRRPIWLAGIVRFLCRDFRFDGGWGAAVVPQYLRPPGCRRRRDSPRDPRRVSTDPSDRGGSRPLDRHISGRGSVHDMADVHGRVFPGRPTIYLSPISLFSSP